MHARWLLVGYLVVAGCSAAPPAQEPDARVADASADARDVGADATDAHVTLDGGELTAECMWWGYGTRCPVACSSPPNVEFRAVPHFHGNGFCCDGFPADAWDHCVCLDGWAACPVYPGDAVGITPFSRCEFCGTGEDAAVHDAGPSDDAAVEEDAGAAGDAG